MAIFYVLITLLLLSAFILIAVPFIKTESSILSLPFFSILFFMTIFSLGTYLSLGQTNELRHWFSYGKNHYQLAIEVDRLGGLDGLIAQLEQKLRLHPDEAKGWFILGKLYFSKQDSISGSLAIEKAHDLQPENDEITAYYDKIKKQ